MYPAIQIVLLLLYELLYLLQIQYLRYIHVQINARCHKVSAHIEHTWPYMTQHKTQ